MSHSSASRNKNIQHVMRTALVGIKPADQVMLKGYLRILLRLEADLEWVSANHPEVDLYLINNDFRQANNIIKLIESHPKTPVLYVGRGESGEGGLEDDLLNLPLKETSVLNDWLFDHLAMLEKKSSFSRRGSSSQSKRSTTQDQLQSNTTKQSSMQTATSKQNRRSPSISSSNQSQQSSNAKPSDALTVQKSNESDYSPLIEVIQQLQQRSKGVYQLFSKETLLATIEPSKSLVWVEDSDMSALKANGLTTLRLQLVSESSRSVVDALDMKQWLWEICWQGQGIEEIAPLVNHDTLYQLRFWVKPVGVTNRRDLLRVMVAMEKVATNIKKIAENSDCSVEYVKKVVAGLLFSGYLQDDIYREIRIDDTVALSSLHAEQVSKASTETTEPRTLDSVLSRRASGEKANVSTSSEIPASVIGSSTQKDATSDGSQSAESKKSPEKTKKQGFLARLRRKLGL